MTETDHGDDVDHALELAEQLAETGVLGPKQAKVYALRDVHGIGRSDAADVLELSPNTVDNHLADARNNVQGARDLLSLLENR